MNADDVQALSTVATVPLGLDFTLKAAMLLLQTEKYSGWPSAQRVMQDPAGFIGKIKNLDFNSISDEMHSSVAAICSNTNFKEFKHESINNGATSHLQAWVIAVNNYYEAVQELKTCR